MIFVTVGTHEQSFDRLVQCVDQLAASTTEAFFIQYGYHTRPPVHAQGDSFVDRERMEKLIRDARLVITHGGPGSISACLEANKVPIVVPRQHKFDEHLDDHQLQFCRRLAVTKRVILVEDMGELAQAIQHYDQLVAGCCKPQGLAHQARASFCHKLASLLDNVR